MRPSQLRRVMPRMIAAGAPVLLSGSLASPVGRALPKDPCALLQVSEIQALAPSAQIGSGKPSAAMAPLGVECMYTWGPRTREWGESALTVSVIDGSKAWPGRSADELEEGLLAKAKASGPDASQVSGVGDAAVFTFETRSSLRPRKTSSRRGSTSR